jgi:hypothetical protein
MIISTKIYFNNIYLKIIITYMGIVEIMRGLLSQTKKIETSSLPSQGLFYKPDFELRIKKADVEDIIDYEYNYDKDNLYMVIESVKKIVSSNTQFSKNYKFEDIKSVDIIFIFLEIVKLTMNKTIKIPFFNDEMGKPDLIEFSNKTFNYFNFDKYEVDKKNGEIVIDNYRFSMPSIGIENCLTNFLVLKSDDVDAKKWNSYNYDFLFFVGNKNNLTFSEIENLVTIFNFDLEPSEQDKIRKIVKEFMGVVSYSLQINGRVVDVKSKLDLEAIWKD